VVSLVDFRASLSAAAPAKCPFRNFLNRVNRLDSMEVTRFGEGSPMWTLENRPKYNRDHLRYPSDLTDDEWACVAPLIPPPKPGGGKRRTDMRAVMNAVMYILSTGCQWRYLPKDFPPYSTVHHYFVWWHCDGVLDRIHHALYVACREKAEREASPTAAIIDSQSVKSAEKGGPASIHMAMMRAKRSRARSVIYW
jgi:transposase